MTTRKEVERTVEEAYVQGFLEAIEMAHNRTVEWGRRAKLPKAGEVRRDWWPNSPIATSSDYRTFLESL